MRFFKLHGLGNDFVLFDFRRRELALSRERLRGVASRTLGVGCDQVLILKDSRKNDARLLIYNTDGSRAEMCGNGLRAAALYLFLRHRRLKSVVLETDAGPRSAKRIGKLRTENCLIECEMGVPKLVTAPSKIAGGVKIGAKKLKPVCANVGNPHAVFFSSAPIASYGRAIERHKAFPKRTNVEFVRVLGKNKISVQVWERGVGITEACGTGAVASSVASISKGLVKSPVTVNFSGGSARVEWAGAGKVAKLTGTASLVFVGTLKLSFPS